MSNNEERIRELAYQIWESEGKPEGQTEKHWEMARKLVESEQQGELAPPPEKKATTRKSTRKAPAKGETQAEKPALMGKPAARRKKDDADGIAKAPDKAQAATKARTPRNKSPKS